MLMMRFPEGKSKALTLSYDDGVEQDERLIQILDAAGIRCTFNLNSGCFPPEGMVWPAGQVHRRLPASRVAALYRGGHEVAVHTLTHPDLTQLPLNEMIREINADRANLEKLFGGLVRGAAYPYGTYSDLTVEALKACGIAYCRTVNATHGFQIPRDWLRLHPTCHHADPQLDALCDRFLEDGARYGSIMFYLWGHAYEFEGADNWDVIERFAEKMGGRDDIWYATNIAIHDYVEAWRSLLISADGRTLVNPTATALYAGTEKGIVEIGAGATVVLG